MLEKIRSQLLAHGFIEAPETFMPELLRSFSRPTSSKPWNIGAHWRAAVHGDDEQLELSLETSPQQAPIGTHHRVMNAAALSKDLPAIIADLEGLAADPEKLQCPKCRKRRVLLKEGLSPFLSCEGMMRVRGKIPCDGVSYQIPALIIYE